MVIKSEDPMEDPMEKLLEQMEQVLPSTGMGGLPFTPSSQIPITPSMAEILQLAENGNHPAQKKGGRPPLSGEDWQKRYEQVEKVLALCKKHGITQRQACARAGLLYETFRTWKRRMMRGEKVLKKC